MKISTILDHIDSGHMALPEFQRGYVWNRDQVRGLFDSLYRRHPVGSLLVWATDSSSAKHRGDGELASGTVKLLLDGQQRMTTLYGVVRGHPPKFFEGNSQAFTGLCFNLETTAFEFYQPVKMRDDPLWVNVTEVMRAGVGGLEAFMETLEKHPTVGKSSGRYSVRAARLLSILELSMHVEEISGMDKSLDVVVDIFNRVNSGGTKLSKGDLALAKICADWPEARAVMKTKLKEWSSKGYSFSLDWLLRSVNTVLTGEAKFSFLHEKNAEEVQDALTRANKAIDHCLNFIGDRLGLDHDQVLFGRYAIPVMVRYLDLHKRALSEIERDKLLFWFAQSGMWGRFSGSTESFIDKDLAAIESPDKPLDALLEQLRLWHGGLRVEPGHFSGWSLGARFYPVLYMLTRMGEAKDWGTLGLALKAHLLGRLSSLEVHHIFPKAQLYKRSHSRSEVNALANFCFLTKETNLRISDRLPEEYFPEIEKDHPGALASQWIPMDKALWKIENYPAFLEARKQLLADEANRCMAGLLHGETKWLESAAPITPTVTEVVGGIDSEDEEQALTALNDWVEAQGLPRGTLAFDFADPNTGAQQAVFDLAWPTGLQEEFSSPVAVLLNEGAEVIALASRAGYQCFTSADAFKRYVQKDILSAEVSQ